jgi:hypothetical protein
MPRSINGRYRPNVTIAARIGHRENVTRTLTIKAPPAATGGKGRQ